MSVEMKTGLALELLETDIIQN